MPKSFFNKPKTINCNGELVSLSTPLVMGILNLTPDSFYDGGKYTTENSIRTHLESMIEEGASIIDIGAVSTRPKSSLLTENEEWERLMKVLPFLKNYSSQVYFSIDTFRATIAQKAVYEYDVAIINDISAGELDKKMFETVAQLNVPYVMMHMQGTPQTMQDNPYYDDVTQDIIKYFSTKVAQLKLMGVNDIILDPGFGFGKTLEHNYELMEKLDDFKIFELPFLVGVSRKSMISKVLEITSDESLNGTTALNTVLLMKGADILRVHDVKEAVQAVKIVSKLYRTN